MRRIWELADLVDCFTIIPSEMKIIQNKSGSTRIGFAVLLKYFQNEGRFPNNRSDIPKPVVDYIAKQVFVDPEIFLEYDWNGRAIKYHRAEIRDFLGFHEATVEDFDNMVSWLVEKVLIYDHDPEHLKEKVFQRFRELYIEPVTSDRIEKIIRSAIHVYEDRFFKSIYEIIPLASLPKIDELIESVTAISDLDDEDSNSDSLSLFKT